MNAARKLQRKLKDDERHIRMINWARWANSGNDISMNYPTWCDIWKGYIDSGRVAQAIAEEDAMLLEHVITTLDMCSRSADNSIYWGQVWSYVLKLEYLWAPRPVELRAKMVSDKFKRPCARRTYHKHVQRAKAAVFAIAPQW